MNAPLLVLSTCPDAATAQHIATRLVESKLAACVNILSGLRSVYLWQGRTHDESEVMLLIKTRQDAYERLEATLVALHPYELPEVLAVPILNGLSDYLAWINNTVEPI